MYTDQGSCLLLLHKLQRFLARHHVNRTGLVAETDTVALLRHMQHLRSESSTDELPIRRVRDGLQHLRDSRTVLRIEVGIDLVEQIERCRIAGLDGEHKC